MIEKQELLTMDPFRESLLAHAEKRGLTINVEEIHLILSFFLSPGETAVIHAAQLPDVIRCIDRLAAEETTLIVLRFIQSQIEKELGGAIAGKITLRGNQKKIKGFIDRAKELVKALHHHMMESYAIATQ